MDNAGWHATRQAHRDVHRQQRHRGPDGLYQPVEQALPINGPFMIDSGSHLPPPPYALDQVNTRSRNSQDGRVHNGGIIYENPGRGTNNVNRPGEDGVYVTHQPPSSRDTFHQQRLAITGLSAVERSQRLRVIRMKPHLQFMAGPLLRYDTVDTFGVWHGFCLIVTADAGSIYDPHPMLAYEWDPESTSTGSSRRERNTFDLGPHPADPLANIAISSNDLSLNGHERSSRVKKDSVPGHEIWVYVGYQGTFTFWRFSIQIPLSAHEMSVRYNINNGQEFEFFLPGRNQNMRWATYSCNGFSAGVNPDDFRGPGFKSGFDPVWTDVLEKHAESPFHVLVGGGDQIYCDAVTREPELQKWITLQKPEEKKKFPITEEIEMAIDRFYFNHYCNVFRSGAFARANSSIPMANMTDDHDLIDGFGSYPEDLQTSPVFQTIGSRGYFFFLLFQCFINGEVDGYDDRPGMHSNKSLIFGKRGPFIPYPSHSFLTYMGPDCYLLLLDCRAERRRDQVCSEEEYSKVFYRLSIIPGDVRHLIVQLGIPIAYPRMVFLETALESKLNPLVALGRRGSLGMSGLLNKFNADAELLDDLNDHWTAKGHKKERNWFILRLQDFAKTNYIRITFLSGDVHCAAVGLLKTYTGEKDHPGISPEKDHRYMLNIVTSAIVNTPPPPTVLSLVSALSTKTHKTLHHAQTDEIMVPLFEIEPDGSVPKSKYIMGRRNWCSVEYIDRTGEVQFNIRVEIEKGIGRTKCYQISAPPPRWSRN